MGRFYEYYPKPSELFFDGQNRKQLLRGDTRIGVAGLSLFKTGVEPKWEDDAHKTGFYMEARLKGKDSPSIIDNYWRGCVLCAIGSSLNDGGLLTGVRIVDKTRGGKQQIQYKCELWFRGEVTRMQKYNIEEQIEKALGDGLKLPNP